MIDIADVKIAVLQCAMGIKSLQDKELFERLEKFWISAYALGRGVEGPEFSDGPEFKGWAERSGDGWECKACGNWHPPRTLRCLNNNCHSYGPAAS